MIRRYGFALASALVAIGVGGYAAQSTGRLSAASIFLVIAALVLAATVWMLFRAATAIAREPEPLEVEVASGRKRKELEREKQLLLKALKELEFDHEMGKISDADFKDIGGRYRARAVRILRQLDQGSGESYRSLVEKELVMRRGAKTAGAAPAAPSVGEAAGANQTTPPTCPTCGTGNDIDAEFCKRCGKKLELAKKAAP